MLERFFWNFVGDFVSLLADFYFIFPPSVFCFVCSNRNGDARPRSSACARRYRRFLCSYNIRSGGLLHPLQQEEPGGTGCRCTAHHRRHYYLLWQIWPPTEMSNFKNKKTKDQPEVLRGDLLLLPPQRNRTAAPPPLWYIVFTVKGFNNFPLFPKSLSCSPRIERGAGTLSVIIKRLLLLLRPLNTRRQQKDNIGRVNTRAG